MRKRTSLAEIFKEEFVIPYGVMRLASYMNYKYDTVMDVLEGKVPSKRFIARLARVTSTTKQFWYNVLNNQNKKEKS